jgi:hypothetical protein
MISAANEAQLVDAAVEDAAAFAGQADHFGFDSREMEAWADYGGHLNWMSTLVNTPEARAELDEYSSQVTPAGCAWMDNTTIVTASALLSDVGPNLLTPVTMWDLATWCRAVVCYERIYHHRHDAVHDDEINRLLGADVVHAVDIPDRPPSEGLPQPYNGVIFRLCEIEKDAEHRIKQLADAVGTDSLDGRELEAVRRGWSEILGRDLTTEDVVDWRTMSVAFTSQSLRLLEEIAAVDNIKQPTPSPPDRPTDQGGVPFILARLPSENNLRSYMNQRFADDLALPYERGIARMPFHRHLEARAARIQATLVTAELLDARYMELADGASLRVPVFLALALQEAQRPQDLWASLARQRAQATKFRTRRLELDQALADGDTRLCRDVSKALSTDVDHFGDLVGEVVSSASTSVLATMARGTPDTVSVAVAGAAAATQGLLSTSLKERILWRLRRPQLLYLNDLVDEAKHLTNALPRVSQIWQLPRRAQDRFANRMHAIGNLSRS